MLKVLDNTYARFVKSNSETLSDLNEQHDIYPECFELGRDKGPLDVKSILLKHGKTEEQANILIEDLAEQESYETMVLELNK